MAISQQVDEARLEELMHRFVTDLGAAVTAPMVLIGDQLGLYKAMADGEPITPAQLAERTGCRERYLREWLCQQAPGVDDQGRAQGRRAVPHRQGDGLA